jgi:hypothetical protein
MLIKWREVKDQTPFAQHLNANPPDGAGITVTVTVTVTVTGYLFTSRIYDSLMALVSRIYE